VAARGARARQWCRLPLLLIPTLILMIPTHLLGAKIPSLLEARTLAMHRRIHCLVRSHVGGPLLQYTHAARYPHGLKLYHDPPTHTVPPQNGINCRFFFRKANDVSSRRH
jgi:hypothetical protein